VIPGRWRLVANLVATALAAAGSAMVATGVAPGRPPQPTGSAAVSTEGPAAVSAEAADGSPTAPSSSAAIEPVDTAGLSRSTPVRLDIPAIGVHTALVEVGLNADHTIAVPPLTGDAPAGWYRDLASPGETGTAVILGHVDTARDGPAVFFRLGALRAGDKISVRRADGGTADFTVVTVAEYPKSAFPADAVYGPADRPVLRLITCGGEFDRSRRSYRSNIVVYAEMVPRAPERPTRRLTLGRSPVTPE
jgi:sortase (surface protein transpeptidase)